MQPGFYSTLSNADYHGGPGESKSLLDLVRRSPAHYRARKLSANDNEATEAQKTGTAFHALLLEPQEFVKTYCLALRPQDVDTKGAPLVESREQLVAMVEDLNKTRLPKLSSSGTKEELVARILEAESGETVARKTPEELQAMKGTELKDYISHLNASRPGLLSTTGTMPQLAQLLADAGRPVVLWSDVKAQWLQNNPGRQVLELEEWDQLHQMRDAVMAHPAARALLTGAPGVAEHSVYWRDPATGLLCRCRPDFWRADGIVVDLKTTTDASPEGFARSIAGWRYHVQAPFYLDGIACAQDQARGSLPAYAQARPKAFVFLAVEKGARVVDGVALGVGVYVLDEESMAIGRQEYAEDLATIAQCQKSGKWPGYSERIEPISLPRWKKAQADQAA